MKNVIDEINYGIKMEDICWLIVYITAAFFIVCGTKNFFSVYKGTHKWTCLIAPAMLFIFCLFSVWSSTKIDQTTNKKYLILTQDYDFTAYLDGNQVNLEDIDMSKYTIEIDSNNKKLKLTKIEHRSHIIVF